jgi:hypothetical protein
MWSSSTQWTVRRFVWYPLNQLRIYMLKAWRLIQKYNKTMLLDGKDTSQCTSYVMSQFSTVHPYFKVKHFILWPTLYLFYTITVHESLVLCLSGVPEKVGINQKGVNQKLYFHKKKRCQSQWACGLRYMSADTHLLGLWVRISLGHASWMSVSCKCHVLSSRGLCMGLIQSNPTERDRQRESVRMRARTHVCVCVSCVIRCNNNPLHLQWLGRGGMSTKKVTKRGLI